MAEVKRLITDHIFFSLYIVPRLYQLYCIPDVGVVVRRSLLSGTTYYIRYKLP